MWKYDFHFLVTSVTEQTSGTLAMPRVFSKVSGSCNLTSIGLFDASPPFLSGDDVGDVMEIYASGPAIQRHPSEVVCPLYRIPQANCSTGNTQTMPCQNWAASLAKSCLTVRKVSYLASVDLFLGGASSPAATSSFIILDLLNGFDPWCTTNDYCKLLVYM